MTLVEHAYKLLKSDPEYLADARECPPRANNTIVGSVLSLTTGRPRQYTEAAVREALARIAKEEA